MIFGLSIAVFGIVTISNVASASGSITHTLAGVGFILAGVLFIILPFTRFGEIYAGPIVWFITWGMCWYFGAICMFVASILYY